MKFISIRFISNVTMVILLLIDITLFVTIEAIKKSMSDTLKFYYNKKPTQIQMETLAKTSQCGKFLTKINTGILRLLLLGKHVQVINELEMILQACEMLKQVQKAILNKEKKVMRSPFKAIFLTKLQLLSSSNSKKFQQLLFVLKEMIFTSFKNSSGSISSLTWCLELVSVYNVCRVNVNAEKTDRFNANICSNTYPNLLLPQSNLYFGAVLKLHSQSRVEENILRILSVFLNINQDYRELKSIGSYSSLEVLKDLTRNIVCENKEIPLNERHFEKQNIEKSKVDNLLHRESVYVTDLIWQCRKTVPSLFYGKQNNHFLLKEALKTVWTQISTNLDHFILWWIENPISCYGLSYVNLVRKRILMDSSRESQEPLHSSLRALYEALTVFASSNVWDQMFRITLATSSHSSNVCRKKVITVENKVSGTFVGKAWNNLFTNLNTINNNFLLPSAGSAFQIAVTEQIPILHRIDHSIHSMRIWAEEEYKLQSLQWAVDVVFNILNFDVRLCLQILSSKGLPRLSMDNADISMTVCLSLREKLILEIEANILKLQNTNDDCISVLSSVCRTLSLANLVLSFPPRQHWKQHFVSKTKKAYVSFVLDQIFQPALRATNDITMLELILKLVCEAWIDFIYSQKIRFSEAGAVALLNNFDEVNQWISSNSCILSSNVEKLLSHEVLRMCVGVGKILLRKPSEIIPILPKTRKSSTEEPFQKSELPSEMLVSNQSMWLQLGAFSGQFDSSVCCTKTYT